MTTINEAREAVYARWNTQWDSTTPFAFENESSDLAKGVVPWAHVHVRHLDGGQDTLGAPGNRRYRRAAVVMIQLHALVDSGLATLDTLAATARTIFEGVSFSGLDFNDVQTRESGPDGKWYQVMVTAFFDYDETK